MSNDIEYIEPTQEHIGQMVEVRDSDIQEWRQRKLLGIIDYRLRFVVEPEGVGLPLPYKHARIPRPLTYAERQAKCGLKVGDRVKFVRAWSDSELGVHLEFFDEMSRVIGQIGTITEIKKSNRVRFDGAHWWLPYFVLEKVTDRVATQNDCGATVYVDGTPQDEFRIIVLWQEVDSVWRAVIRSGDKRFVYELNNLRVKE